jgi:TfoX/Sxy family transcriptional regulator of competence genes
VSYDERLADRIRKAASFGPWVVERHMFGGLAFLFEGRMFCGVVEDRLMVRVGPNDYEQALCEPHVGPMDFTGRPMKGYVFVLASGCRTQRSVDRWASRGAAFVSTLGPKPRKPAAR